MFVRLWEQNWVLRFKKNTNNSKLEAMVWRNLQVPKSFHIQYSPELGGTSGHSWEEGMFHRGSSFCSLSLNWGTQYLKKAQIANMSNIRLLN